MSTGETKLARQEKGVAMASKPSSRSSKRGGATKSEADFDRGSGGKMRRIRAKGRPSGMQGGGGKIAQEMTQKKEGESFAD